MWEKETEGATQKDEKKDRSGRKRDRDGRQIDRMRESGRERTISSETEVGETHIEKERERAIEKERHGGREKDRKRLRERERERETGVRER